MTEDLQTHASGQRRDSEKKSRQESTIDRCSRADSSYRRDMNFR